MGDYVITVVISRYKKIWNNIHVLKRTGDLTKLCDYYSKLIMVENHLHIQHMHIKHMHIRHKIKDTFFRNIQHADNDIYIYY